MTARQWFTQHFGKRPTELPHAQAVDKVKLLDAAMKRASKECAAAKEWDRMLKAVELLWNDKQRPWRL